MRCNSSSFGGDRDVRPWGLDRVQVLFWHTHALHRHTRCGCATAGNLPGRLRRQLESGHGDLIGKGVASLVSGQGAYSYTLIEVFRGVFDLSLLQRDRVADLILKV